MEFKDYYAALGVSPDADAKTIKQAYRKLARQYHPDTNPGDSQAEERFKAVNEAYQALGDTERRATYDDLRQQHERWQQRGGAGEWGWGQGAQGAYTRTATAQDINDLFGEEGSFSDFFSSLFGQGVGGAGGSYEPMPRRGRDLEVEAEITLEEAFHGATRSIQVGERRIEARIPRGVRSGSRIRLSGQGGPGVAGGPAGDLFLTITVLPHPQFERDGDDLVADVAVDFLTAAIGGEVRVPTLDGSVRLKIPPRTEGDMRFRLRDKGMPRTNRPGERGSLYARVKLTLPSSLSDEEIDTLRNMREQRQPQTV